MRGEEDEKIDEREKDWEKERDREEKKERVCVREYTYDATWKSWPSKWWESAPRSTLIRLTRNSVSLSLSKSWDSNSGRPQVCSQCKHFSYRTCCSFCSISLFLHLFAQDMRTHTHKSLIFFSNDSQSAFTVSSSLQLEYEGAIYSRLISFAFTRSRTLCSSICPRYIVCVLLSRSQYLSCLAACHCIQTLISWQWSLTLFDPSSQCDYSPSNLSAYLREYSYTY